MDKVRTPITNESNVSGYSKSFPTTFRYAKNDILVSVEGNTYLDFFSGAGALNYGHNNDMLKEAIIEFLDSDAPIHFLDMDSVMKLKFLEKFNEVILNPRGLKYKVQFPSPSGTNAVEAAIKLARKVTKRSMVVSFTNSFHGMTATSLAVSGSQESRHGDIPAQDVLFFPYDGFMGPENDSMKYLSEMLLQKGSGNQLPAAIILETIQAEGGIRIAEVQWLKKLESFARDNNIVLIVDDIQVGCGRTGNFFSFERAGIVPDIVLLSKSISGFGLPLSLVLIKPDLDIWTPGEHNGTFRANNLSLCGATKALEYWENDDFTKSTVSKGKIVAEALKEIFDKTTIVEDYRGLGLIWGIELKNGDIAKAASKHLFDNGLIIETCGSHGQVLKILPPLTITNENLKSGLHSIKQTLLKLEGKEVVAYSS